MFHTLKNWLRKTRFSCPNTSTSRRPSRVRLNLEALEAREVLSATMPQCDPVAVSLHKISMGPLVGPSDGHGFNGGYSPADLRHAYGIDQVLFPGGIQGDGTGQTIAIVVADFSPTMSSDLHQFDVEYGLPDPTFTLIPAASGGHAGGGWPSECAIDVEMAHAMAPGASIVVIDTPTGSMADLLGGVKLALDYDPSVVSMSWGAAEFAGETSFDAAFTGHTGVTFVAASGDNGALQWPAISPNVVGVGGTSLSLDSAGNYASEVAWSNSGGGVSQFEPQPSYQNGVVSQSNLFRAGPDVALDADPNRPVSIYYQGAWFHAGGTSVAAPMFAGLIAIADQGRALKGLAPLDGPTQTLPMLYSLPSSDFHGITVNDQGQSLGTGYNLVTGRGSPVGNLLVPALADQPVASFHLSVSAPTSTAAGSTFSVTVTVRNQFNQVVSGYAGTVHFGSSDTQANLPADYTFTTADAGSHTFTITLNTPGAQSLTVSDQNNVVSGNTTINVALTPNQLFVEAAYKDILGRIPTAGELNAWSTLLDQGAPTIEVATALAHSAEYYGNLVTKDYQQYLGRAPSPSEVQTWVYLMQHGLTDEQLEAGLIGSAEYIGSKHAGPGNWAPWVIGMYQDLLGRTPSPAEVAAWVQALNAGVPPTQIAHDFAASPEREGQRITADYLKYLGRAPSQAEINAWVNAFENGYTNEDVIAGFVGSSEYYQEHA
jgi:hypothetical protein